MNKRLIYKEKNIQHIILVIAFSLVAMNTVTSDCIDSFHHYFTAYGGNLGHRFPV